MSRTGLAAYGFTAATASAPAVVGGQAIATTYPGVVTGALPGSTERTANGTAMQAFLDWCVTNGKVAFFPAGRYEYIATATQNSRNTGLHAKKNTPGLLGAGSSDLGTLFVQYGTNYPVLTIGDVSNTAADLCAGGKFGGFQLGFSATQTGSTSGDALLLGRCWRCDFDDILVTPFLVGTSHPYRGITIGISANQFFFSNHIGTVTVFSALQNYFYSVAGMTGNRWDNVYLGSGTYGSRVALAAEPMFLNSSGSDFGSFGQLNIEWCDSASSQAALRIDNCDGGNINHLHLEGVKMSGFNCGAIGCASSRFRIGSMKMLDVWIASGNASGVPAVVQMYGDSRVKIDQLYAKWAGSGVNSEAVASMTFAAYTTNDSTVGRDPSLEIGQCDLAGNTGAFNLDTTLTGAAPGSAGAIYGFKRYVMDRTRSFTEGAVIEARNADLTVYAAHRRPNVRLKQALTADHKVVLSSNMAASGIGNVVTRLAGDTVRAVRESGATGAFNWNIRDSADAVSAITLTAASTEGSAVLDSAGTWDAS